MARATDQQVQIFVDERIRRRCEQVIKLLVALKDDKALIDDIYDHVSEAQEPATWVDNRTDGPPHLFTSADVLGVNTFYDEIISAIENSLQLPIVRKACVRTLE